MSLEVSQKIQIEKVDSSKIGEVDFDNLPFGEVRTDHMLISEYADGKWEVPRIIPYQNISLDPSAKIFHYGQSIFEGMKAYKDENGRIWLFRPQENQKRLNISAKRLAMPELPEEYFMEGLSALLKLEKNWIPTTKDSSMYVRPFMFASGTGFHASPANRYTFVIACSPSGAYFGGKIKVLIEEKYARAANGGVGFAKAGGNYAGQFYPTNLAIEKGYQQVIWTDDISHEFIEEAGAMNIFVRIGDKLLTAPISDRILDGVTRKSIIAVAQDMGIEVEVRKISVRELIEAHSKGELKEMFGAGTAAVISPISGFGYQNKDYELASPAKNYADILKKKITDIQYNRDEDKFNWRYEVK
jgi:branched-chain amino acid aminotransferase